jgi:Mrp family chromosome partitioning ATPase
MTNTRFREQFQMLRARIESTISMPCALLVTSAGSRDGKSVCAFGLAKSWDDVGYRTALVDINYIRPQLSGVPQPTSLSSFVADGAERYAVRDPETNLVLMSLAKKTIAESASRQTISETLNILRGRYDIVIIDASRMLDSSLTVLFAGVSDGVLLTLCEGRSVSRDDQTTLELLAQSRANVIGVVTIAPAAIAAFTGRDHKEEGLFKRPVALGAVEVPHRAHT